VLTQLNLWLTHCSQAATLNQEYIQAGQSQSPTSVVCLTQVASVVMIVSMLVCYTAADRHARPQALGG